MMNYEMTTLQYGSLKDVYEYKDINALLHDLSSISEMKSIEVMNISRKGVTLSRLRLRILLSLAKVHECHCLKSYLEKKGCL
jgi:hypothetical protein